MPRESAEERIARIVRETMGAERQRAEDESDPAVGRLRRIIRDEVGAVLGELLSDRGDRGRRRTSRGDETDDNEDDGGGGLAEILGLGGGRR